MLNFFLIGRSGKPQKPRNITRDDYCFTKEYITWLIKKDMKKKKVTGLSIALVDDRQIVWTGGFGFADKANRVAATPETIYRAGSISKLFTAMAIMQLVEQGKMDIDKPLQIYIPEFSIRSHFQNADPITLRTILTHHSGLPSDFLEGMFTNTPEPFRNVIEKIKPEYVSFPPNTVFSYSNLGFTLLGCALEQVVGQSYDSYMNTMMLPYLRMTHSLFSQCPDNSPLAAKAYRNNKEADETPLRDTPAGGLNTKVLDLSRFIMAVLAEGRLNGQQIVKASTLSEMLRPQNTQMPLDLDARIGFAWVLSNSIRNAGLVASHSGGTLCHRSMLMVLPEHKLGVVVLSGSASSGALVSKMATETLKLALEAKTGIKQPDKTKLPKKASRSQSDLRSYVGNYDTLAGVAEVTTRSGHLQAKVGHKALRLIPRADGRFYLQYRLFKLIPVNLGRPAIIAISRTRVEGHDIVELHVDDRKFFAGELIQQAQLPRKWLQHTGRYQCINRADNALTIDKVRLRQHGGLLLLDYSVSLDHKNTITLALTPVSDSEALIYGLGPRKGETIRFVEKEGNYLFWYSGYLFKKIQE